MRRCLERAFGEPPGSLARSGIVIRPHSLVSTIHLGYATTRRGRLYLPGDCNEFWSDPHWVLHEYFHLLRQWRPRTLSVFRYVAAALRHPSAPHARNRFEKEADAFARAHVAELVECLARGPAGVKPGEALTAGAAGRYTRSSSGA
jgi:hypothetical protein